MHPVYSFCPALHRPVSLNFFLSFSAYSKFNSSTVLKPSDIITGNGCSALLDQLFHVLLDEGEGALLSKPYYSGFDRDLKPRSGTVLVGVPLEEEGEQEGDIEKRFGRALRESEAKCVKVRSLHPLDFKSTLDADLVCYLRSQIRAMIICNPTNPLGKTYSRQTLLEYALFAEKHNLHLVSDEIYGLSVYNNPDFEEAEPFTSMLSLDVEKETGVRFDKSRLHGASPSTPIISYDTCLTSRSKKVISGASKDFAW